MIYNLQYYLLLKWVVLGLIERCVDQTFCLLTYWLISNTWLAHAGRSGRRYVEAGVQVYSGESAYTVRSLEVHLGQLLMPSHSQMLLSIIIGTNDDRLPPKFSVTPVIRGVECDCVIGDYITSVRYITALRNTLSLVHRMNRIEQYWISLHENVHQSEI